MKISKLVKREPVTTFKETTINNLELSDMELQALREFAWFIREGKMHCRSQGTESEMIDAARRFLSSHTGFGMTIKFGDTFNG